MASVSIAGNTSGSVTLSAPDVAGSTTLTLPTTSGTVALTASPTFTGQATIPTINLTGGQITFPATQSASANANTLDDYEEGTWTPTDTSGASLSFTVDYATYTKIGRTVTVQAAITYPSTANGSSAKIGGLPFTAANAITVSVIYSTATVANFTYLSGNTTDLFALTPGVNVTNATLSTRLIQLAGTYQV